jgi:hypothetical protein
MDSRRGWLWAGARRRDWGTLMLHKHYGAAVAIAGLLTGSPIALGEVEEGSHVRTEVSNYGGWNLDAPKGILIVDCNKVAGDIGADARNTRSSPPENDPVSEYHAIIPPTTRSSVISDLDPFQTTVDDGNFNNIGTFANKSARPSVSTPTGSSRALTSVSHATTTSPPTGCARCVGQVARASAGRAKSFASLFSWNFFRKGGIQTRHSMTGIVRQRNPPLLTALTIQRGWRDSSL